MIQSLVPRFAELVPLTFSILLLFVVVVTGATVALLGWRSARVKSDYTRY